jgi:hypothetical protein
MSYISWTGHILLAIQVILFCSLEIIARPKAIDKYGFKQKMKIILLPFKYGLQAIRAEDTGELLVYRRLWLLIWGLLAIRIVLAVATGYMTQNPGVLMSAGVGSGM